MVQFALLSYIFSLASKLFLLPKCFFVKSVSLEVEQKQKLLWAYLDLTYGMGLDRAPIEVEKFLYKPQLCHCHCICICQERFTILLDVEHFCWIDKKYKSQTPPKSECFIYICSEHIICFVAVWQAEPAWLVRFLRHKIEKGLRAV